MTLENLYISEDDRIKISGFRRRVRTTKGVQKLIEKLPLAYVCKERRELLLQCEESLSLTLAYSEYKADVYSLGVCFILIAYNLNQIGENDSSMLKEALAQLYEHQKLQYLLTKMLAEEEKDRPDFLELKTLLATQAVLPEFPAPDVYPAGENPILKSSIEIKVPGHSRNQICSLCEKSLDSSHPTLCTSCAAQIPIGRSNPGAKIRTRKCKCSGFRAGKILLSNDLGEWPADLEVVFLPMGEPAREQDCYEGREAEANIAKGGKVVKVVLGRNTIDARNGVPRKCTCCSKAVEAVPGIELSDSQALVCSPECLQRLSHGQIPVPAVRFYTCHTCLKTFSVSLAELERVHFAPERTNFCQDDCILQWQSANASIETSPNACFYCQRTLDSSLLETQAVKLECGRDHFFCTKKCLAVYVQEQLFRQVKLEEIACGKCGHRIAREVLNIAEVDMTQSMYFARQSDICQNCRTSKQQAQLDCNHCFCLACIPSYPTNRSKTACPICSRNLH